MHSYYNLKVLACTFLNIFSGYFTLFKFFKTFVRGGFHRHPSDQSPQNSRTLQSILANPCYTVVGMVFIFSRVPSSPSLFWFGLVWFGFAWFYGIATIVDYRPIVRQLPGRPGSYLTSSHTKDTKRVRDTPLLNTQHQKVRIKSNWSNPGKGIAPSPTPWCSSY